MGELARFVRVPPDVHQADRRVEPVEHDQRQGQVVQDGPQHVPVEGVPGEERDQECVTLVSLWTNEYML